MQKTKPNINEGLADDISGSFRYCFFIDLHPISNKRGGLLTIMFPNVGSKKLYRWLKGADSSDMYTQNAEKLESLYSRMSTVSSLKTLYRAVNVLKAKKTTPEENETRIRDLQLLMSKIERVIKSKLTGDEREIFNSISSLLSSASNDAAKSVEGSVGASTETPKETEPTEEPAEKPQEQPKEEPKEEPSTEQPPQQEPEQQPDSSSKPAQKPAEKAPAQKPAEKAPAQKPAEKAPAQKPAEKAPAETPAEETPNEDEENQKTESVRMRKYLKSIIREIVERKLGLK
jgi:hypothetical protein